MAVTRTTRRSGIIPKIVVTLVYACSQGQRTHSARINFRSCWKPGTTLVYSSRYPAKYRKVRGEGSVATDHAYTYLVPRDKIGTVLGKWGPKREQLTRNRDLTQEKTQHFNSTLSLDKRVTCLCTLSFKS